MITIQTQVTVDEQGMATLRLPPVVAPGQHDVVLVIEEARAPTKKSIRQDLPRHDVHWPFNPTETFRREDLYGDDGR